MKSRGLIHVDVICNFSSNQTTHRMVMVFAESLILKDSWRLSLQSSLTSAKSSEVNSVISHSLHRCLSFFSKKTGGNSV
jgi:hypothetical protein